MLNALITPINLLDRYASLGDMHLVLSHLIPIELNDRYKSIYDEILETSARSDPHEAYAIGSQLKKELDRLQNILDGKSNDEPNIKLKRKYLEYYRGRSELKILDNGLFENEVAESPMEIITKAFLVDADVVIAPDILYDGDATIKEAKHFVEVVKLFQRTKPLQIMAVPQGSSPEEYLDCYSQLVNNPGIDMIGLSILSLDKSFEKYTGIKSIHVNRIIGINYLWAQGVFHPQKWHHLLGLGDRQDELAAYGHIKNIRSNDTSSPILHGLRKREYLEDGSIENGKLQQKISFFEEFQEMDLTYCSGIILRNIILLLKYAKGL